MLGRKQEFFLKINQLFDAFLLFLAGILAFRVREWLAAHDFLLGKTDLSIFFWVMAIVCVCLPLSLEMLGYYKHPLQKTWIKSAQQIFQGTLIVTLLIGIFSLFFKFRLETRPYLLIFGLIGAGLLLWKDSLVRRHFKQRGLSPEERETVIAAGRPEDVEKMLAVMPPEFLLEVNLVDRFDFTQRPLDELAKLLTDHSVERVFIATRSLSFTQIEEVVSTCEIQGVEAWLSTSFVETSIARPTFDSVGSKPMLVFRSTPDVQWALAIKWIMDKIGAIIGILIMSPFWLIICIGIKIASPKGPIVFKQKRSGKYGKPFTMYKFRSMIPDAEAKRTELMDQNTMSGPVFKVDHDPRIFPLGAFLRKTSLDETPQFFNVLKGEMSLVGPRPLAYYEAINVADAKQRRRFSVKPGLTCTWQISGRNNITHFDDWCRLDLEYIDNWSIWQDIRIILLTIPVLFGSSKGAK